MTSSKPRPRWFHLTPDRLILGLLAVECLLLLSERFRWFGFNQHKGWAVLIAVAGVGVAMVLMLVWFAVARVARWRFQLGIRSRLALILAVAIPCTWMASKVQDSGGQKEAVEWVRWSGGQVRYDHQIQETLSPAAHARPPGAAWLRNLLGGDFFATVVWVDFGASDVTDANLEHLNRLPQLQTLDLWETQVTDAGLGHLKGLAQLQTLALHGTQVTDSGLEPLKGLSQLHWLDLSSTQVTDEGVKKLQQALPNCKIEN